MATAGTPAPAPPKWPLLDASLKFLNGTGKSTIVGFSLRIGAVYCLLLLFPFFLKALQNFLEAIVSVKGSQTPVTESRKAVWVRGVSMESAG